MRAERYGPVTSTGLITISGALLYLPIGLCGADFRRVAALSGTGWVCVAYLIVTPAAAMAWAFLGQCLVPSFRAVYSSAPGSR